MTQPLATPLIPACHWDALSGPIWQRGNQAAVGAACSVPPLTRVATNPTGKNR